MNTEITGNTQTPDSKGWILYDGECRICCSLAGKFQEFLSKHRFELLPLQTSWVIESTNFPKSEWLAEMRFLTPGGTLYGGAEAVLEIARRIWWLWPLYIMAQLPWVKKALKIAYKFTAERRNCELGACIKRKRKLSFIWLNLATLTQTSWLIIRYILNARASHRDRSRKHRTTSFYDFP